MSENLTEKVKAHWQHWSCSLDQMPGELSLARIKQQLQQADRQLVAALESRDLLQDFQSGGTALANYLVLVEHEAHHQGQLINFIYAHHLPIPQSWADKWALSREE